jgi:epoxide hydrolase 4
MAYDMSSGPPIDFARLATNGITLHTALSGPPEGRPVILLHGFPEFWYGWRRQIPALAGQGFRVIAPDQRGYNLSDKPKGISAYRLDLLAQDIIGLADTLKIGTFALAGHDWGAAVAWWLAARYPERVERLAILNVPHGTVFRRHLRRSPSQMLKSWYILFFQIPGLIEALVRRGRGKLLFDSMRRSSQPGTFGGDDFERYQAAWMQPGALTAMVNWYRAIFQQPPRATFKGRIRPPTLVIWGQHDAFLDWRMAQPSVDLCRAGRLVMIEDATHWVQHEKAEQVNALLAEFLSSNFPASAA